MFNNEVIRASDKKGGVFSLAALLVVTFCWAAVAQTPSTPSASSQPAAEEHFGGAVNLSTGVAKWGTGGSPEMRLHPYWPYLHGRKASELPVNTLKVPKGFKVEVWADGIVDARSMAAGSHGTLFVGNRLGKDVYAVVEHGDKREVKVILKDLVSPMGIVFDHGSLYVVENQRITRYDDIENRLDNPPAPVVLSSLPENKGLNPWHFTTLGPDGKLYLEYGTPANLLMPSYIQAAILRFDLKTNVLDTYATGIRNTVGMDFHPVTHQLWFTNNGKDWYDEDKPEDTLFVAKRKGENFGFPFCEAHVLDPDYGKNRSCDEFSQPVALLGSHTAPLGMRFYTGKMFPAQYRNSIFIARHGSWNRVKKQGYDVVRAVIGPKGQVKIEPFLDGFLVDAKQDPPMWGRPADVVVMPDGALMVSDDYNGVVYRVSYAGKK